jgi:type II restriction enzyme
MRRAIESGGTPNLFLLQYEPERWEVSRLLFIPSFAFSLSCIERRPPLRASARRAGWVGCNILLRAIPQEARIDIVANRKPVAAIEVRRSFARLRSLERMSLPARGWTLDVLNLLHSLPSREFALQEAYKLEPALARLHPSNRHIKEKIRQQLQVLRDADFVQFLGRGNYRLR